MWQQQTSDNSVFHVHNQSSINLRMLTNVTHHKGEHHCLQRCGYITTTQNNASKHNTCMRTRADQPQLLTQQPKKESNPSCCPFAHTNGAEEAPVAPAQLEGDKYSGWTQLKPALPTTGRYRLLHNDHEPQL